MKDLRTTIGFKTEILSSSSDKDIKLEIEIDRSQDLFTLFIDGKSVGYGDYQGNLLDLIRTILITEQPFKFAEMQEQMELDFLQKIEEMKNKAGQNG